MAMAYSSSFSSSPLVAFSFVALGYFFLVSLPTHGFPPPTCNEMCIYAVISNEVNNRILEQPRTGASLLRLQFHDCFVNGCDASVLLNDTRQNEQTQPQNLNSIRKMGDIDTIREVVRKQCKGCIPSCADVLAIAARDSVVGLGGPQLWYPVFLGRQDSAEAHPELTKNIPAPNSTLEMLINAFRAQGLSVTDLAALSGAHTVGVARCVTLKSRIDENKNLNKNLLASMQKTCSAGDETIFPLDTTPAKFDTDYFKELQKQRGVLISDQALYPKNNSGKDADTVRGLVESYKRNPDEFFNAFSDAMQKMGSIKSPQRSKKVVRDRCFSRKAISSHI